MRIGVRAGHRALAGPARAAMTVKIRRPALWVAAPAAIVGVAAVVVASEIGLRSALLVAVGGALALGFFVEYRLAEIVAVLVRIARGDRYANLPQAIGDGTMQHFGDAAEAMRSALVDADAIMVDRDRRVTESKLRHAGRVFITKRFQGAIGDVVSAFSDADERIRVTAADLATRNRDMSVRVSSASQSAEAAADNAAHVAAAAHDVREIVLRSGQHVTAAREATDRTVAELQHADGTVRSLSEAAQKIDVVINLIQKIAGQTALLALNATIEAARAGESGRGFAVVASEVKDLARQTAHATGEIRTQIHGIQGAVQETAEAIAAVSLSVNAASAVNRDLNAMLEQQIAELDHIGDEAAGVAATVSRAIPDIQSAIAEVAQAGEAVLGTADDLAGRSQSLVTSVKRYFTDLDHDAIKIGILHSLSGTLTVSERPLQQVLVMLIEQLNNAGGLLGRPVEAVILNPCSHAETYAELAMTMLKQHKVAAIFGCWTSASRKCVIPVIERENGLLFYPSQYEGEEESQNVYYLGATPRQQALPAIDYLLDQGRRRFFLVGTDYVYPHTTNAIIKGYLASRGIADDAVCELYVPFGEKIWRETVEMMRRFGSRGDAVIVSTISGDSNVHFIREFTRQGVRAQDLPVMTLSIGEAELPALASVDMDGHLAAWSYFGSIDSTANNSFVSDWRTFTGNPAAMPNDPMEATLIGFSLWAQAVATAGTTDIDAVRAALDGMLFPAPSGFTVRMDNRNHHLHKPAFIGRINARSEILPVWDSQGLVPPEPWSQWLAGAKGAIFSKAS
jgi:urea transport system substrate-binding protein